SSVVSGGVRICFYHCDLRYIAKTQSEKSSRISPCFYSRSCYSALFCSCWRFLTLPVSLSNTGVSFSAFLDPNYWGRFIIFRTLSGCFCQLSYKEIHEKEISGFYFGGWICSGR